MKDEQDRPVESPPTPETAMTDVQIQEALDALPRDHYSAQWYRDALASHDHPQRRANARRIVYTLINNQKGR